MNSIFPFMHVKFSLIAVFLTCVVYSAAAQSTEAWRISEIFSSGDGSAQYIKLATTSDNQQNLAGQTLRAFDANGRPGQTFTFPANLSSAQTANTSVLIGTDAFASLTQLPVDYRLPPGFLFTDGGSVQFGNLDTLAYQRNQLPRNGYQALNSLKAAVTANPVNFSGKSALFNVDILSVFNDSTAVVNIPVIDVPGSGIGNASLRLTRENPFEFTLVDAYFYDAPISAGPRPARFGNDGKLYLPQVIVGAEVYELNMTLLDEAAMRFGNLEVISVRPRSALPALPAASSGQNTRERVVPLAEFREFFPRFGQYFPPGKATLSVTGNNWVNGLGEKFNNGERKISLSFSEAFLGEIRRNTSGSQSSLSFGLTLRADTGQTSACEIHVSGTVNESALDGRVINLPAPYKQPHDNNITISQGQYCSIADNSGQVSWLMTSSENQLTGQIQLRLEPTSDSTGRLQVALSGSGQVTGEAGVWPQRTFFTGPYQLSAAVDVEYRTDGSFNANGTRLRAPTNTTPPTGVPGTGGSGSTGGSGTSSCVNTIEARNLVSYWPQIQSGSVSGTGRRAAGNTVFADYRSTDVALILDGTTAGTRYVVQIMLTPANLVANRTISFMNAGTGTGLTNSGAVGRLIAFNGSVNDDWRTNRDFGKNQNMGELRITSVTPEIRGTYSFRASGDGYPSLNRQFVNVSGTFCIKP